MAAVTHGWTEPPIAPSDLEAVSFRATGQYATAEGICFLKRYIRLLQVHEHTPPAIRLIAPSDKVRKQRRQYKKGRASREPRARIMVRDEVHPFPETKRAHHGRLEPQWSQQVVLEARIKALEALMRKARLDGKLTEDDRLDAIIIERDNGPYGEVDLERLAHIYGLPSRSIEAWLECIPDPRDGLYDDDYTEPAQKRRDSTEAFAVLEVATDDDGGLGADYASNGFTVITRSELAPGRPKDESSADIIERTTGFSLERCKSLLAKPKQWKGDLESWESGRMQPERDHLDHMLANMVNDKEVTKVQLARLLECNRKTIERACKRGERILHAATPEGLKDSSIRIRRIAAEPHRNGKPTFELERSAIYSTAPIDAAPSQRPQTSRISDLLGCSRSHVYRVAQTLEMGSESPETGAESSTGERPLVVACPVSLGA